MRGLWSGLLFAGVLLGACANSSDQDDVRCDQDGAQDCEPDQDTEGTESTGESGEPQGFSVCLVETSERPFAQIVGAFNQCISAGAGRPCYDMVIQVFGPAYGFNQTNQAERYASCTAEPGLEGCGTFDAEGLDPDDYFAEQGLAAEVPDSECAHERTNHCFDVEVAHVACGPTDPGCHDITASMFDPNADCMWCVPEEWACTPGDVPCSEGPALADCY